MKSEASIVDSRAALERLVRKGSQGTSEVSVVTSPGSGTTAWVIKVKSHHSYNFYNVCAVVINDPGSLPVEIGSEVKAVNVAESFVEQGQLSAGTYAIMFKIGETNTFYVPV